MRNNEDLLFVLGAGKTATTALCGLLNSHPDVFVMCEVYFNNCRISRWGDRLLKKHPEFMPCFFQDFGTDRLENYRRGLDLMRTNGRSLRFFGDKFADMNTGFSEYIGDCRAIFSVRNLPEWIAKDSVRKWFPVDADVVPFAVQYSKHFVESFLLPRVYHVTMDAFLQDNPGVVAAIWRFLDLPAPPKAETWWETIGHYEKGDPKAALSWWRGHGSSAVAPQENDTKVELRANRFWDEILPIFDKYYQGANTATFEYHEVLADLEALQAIAGRHQQPIDQCFNFFHSQSQGHRFRQKKRRSSNESRIAYLLRKMRLN